MTNLMSSAPTANELKKKKLLSKYHKITDIDTLSIKSSLIDKQKAELEVPIIYLRAKQPNIF